MKFGGERFLSSRVKTAKGRKSSSTKWLMRHINDPHVMQAKSNGCRSRSAFKLQEIDQKYNLITSLKLNRPNNFAIIDLGCVPGGWLHFVRSHSHQTSAVLGVDLKPCEAITDVITVQGDFNDPKTRSDLTQLINSKKVPLVLSDMAPNASGYKDVDNARMFELASSALSFALEVLDSDGAFVCKMIYGGSEEMLHKTAQAFFEKVKWFKPKATYTDSAEMFLIALNKKSQTSAEI